MGSGGSAFRNIYTIVGGVLSFFYIAVGMLFLDGKITFDIEPIYRKLLGFVIVLYGFFRLYTFYQRFRNRRNEE
jgi:hypothetical protein